MSAMLLREDIEDAQVCKSGSFTSMSCLLIHAACQPLAKLTMLYHVLPRGCQAQARLKLNLEPFQSHPRSSKYHSAFSCLLVMASLS